MSYIRARYHEAYCRFTGSFGKPHGTKGPCDEWFDPAVSAEQVVDKLRVFWAKHMGKKFTLTANPEA